MAGRKKKVRIEPRLDGPTVPNSSRERTVPSSQKRSARKKAGPKNGARRKSSSGRKQRGFFGGLVYWSVTLSLWMAIGLGAIFGYYALKMPPTSEWAIPDRPPNVRIVDVDGDMIANRGMTGGEAVGLEDMSPFIPQAVIAIEDRRFYHHFGVDPLGIARAVYTNLTQGGRAQGASTLTQQLAKNLFLSPERSIERKVQEAMLALWLERKYSKDAILQMYLNRVYFGSGAYGVEAASRRYFNKSAREVTIDEAALLAGLLKAPSALSPAKAPDKAKARAEVVLAAMRDQGMLTDNQFVTAMSAPVTRAAAHWTGSEHYVADHVMDELPGLIGDVRDDLVVYTTVDLSLQKMAEKAIRERIAEHGAEKNVSQAALVSLDGTGAVRALVGGRDYAKSQFDRATEARRQPGSTFKPFVYLTAIENGWRPESIVTDAPVQYGKWAPENYGGKYYGEVTLAEALRRSLNSVAAQLIMAVTPDRVVDTAMRMGIESPLEINASLALGTSEVTPMELASAYVPFANGGYRPMLHMIDRVEDRNGRVLYRFEGNAPRVLSEEALGMMNYMMNGTIEAGTGRNAAFGWPAAGKTGTTNKSRDAWFVGYTANLVTAVWFGNDDGEPMKNVTGGSMPARAWKEFMQTAHQGLATRPLPGHFVPSLSPGVPMAQHGDGPVGSVNAGNRFDETEAKIRHIISGGQRGDPREVRPEVGVGDRVIGRVRDGADGFLDRIFGR
ncbi:transglycosylase domain-containing protein [Notoacmeibacter ruber]|uniref:Penicillin-binding protein n=1 Tax=Notoacmeibacter ruber TaxID=2670375 RepID=A0A3L7J8V0_9HYPH|nr:transglycosylase domain-containing protein [Notoacmeibacter ruber]RLQ86919.1 penicillin-binding protein [Notoacmeibacter ruber]